MSQSDTSIYEKLPDELLGGFYCEILRNIEKGVLTEAMYHEIDLINTAAAKRGLSPSDLHKSGTLLFKEIKAINC
ncbi:hypothetical protein B9K06_22270 [Bacillus sp. OG2]|nr:hypothetical protein B9K06_22270 [Bacillus sp. OG2]